MFFANLLIVAAAAATVSASPVERQTKRAVLPLRHYTNVTSIKNILTRGKSSPNFLTFFGSEYSLLSKSWPPEIYINYTFVLRYLSSMPFTPLSCISRLWTLNSNLIPLGTARIHNINGITTTSLATSLVSSGVITNELVSYVAPVVIGGKTWELIVDTGCKSLLHQPPQEEHQLTCFFA